MEGLFRGTWYRSAVKLEGETIIPVPPFESYNPFDLYYSASEVRQGDKYKSLYLKFLAVDADKPEEVLNFCQRFGMLGNAYDLLAREYKKAEEHPDLPDWVPAGMFTSSEEIDALFPSIVGSLQQDNFSPKELCGPMEIINFKHAQQNISAVFSPPQKCSDDSSLEERASVLYMEKFADGSILDPKIAIPELLLNGALESHKVRPNISWNFQKAQWEFVWTSMSLLGFLHIMAMLDLLGPGKFLSCPRCRKWFVTTSKRMKFCTSSCGENYKVQKYQKKKKELAAQTGKKTKGTKSTGKKK